MSNVSMEIINFALHQLGAERIISVQDNNKRARLVKDLYSLTRDDVLSEGYWSCCLKTARLSEEPNTDGQRKFKLPPDFIRIKKANVDYTLDGEFLYSNTTTVLLTYVSNSQVVGKYSASLKKAIGYRLAMDMCYTLTQSQELLDRLAVLYQVTMDKGLGYSTIDSNEQVVEISSEINIARQSGSSSEPYFL